MELDTLHAHSMKQSIDQISQERIYQQEECMCNESHINLIVVGKHIGYYRNNTYNKGNTKENRQGIKVDAIFFAQRTEISIHETIHINIIDQDYYICYF